MRNSPVFWSNRNNPNVFDEMQRAIEGLFDPSWQQQREMTSGLGACDFREEEAAYLLTFDIPGMKKEEIKIELHENILSVSGERKREYENEGNQRRFERSTGFFQRSFALPGTIDADKIEAHYSDGVLELMIPKAEAAKAKRIEIQTGQSAFSRLLNPNGKKTEKPAANEPPPRH